VLLRYAGPSDYDIGMIDNGRRATIDRLKAGAWQRLAEVEAPESKDDTWLVEGVHSESLTFRVNGTVIGEVEASPGSMGLAIDSCTVDFTDIQAR
jgi:hypothetical protein